MRKVVTAGQMREIDRLTTERYAIPSLLLMEAAASAAAREIESLFSEGIGGKAVLVLCGRGNNGGDGAALARMLCLRGAFVELVLFGRVEDARGDARVNFEIVRSLSGAAGFRETADELKEVADGFGEAVDAGASGPSLFADSGGRIGFAEYATLEAWEERLRRESGRSLDVIVDALFGTGLTRPLEGLHLEVVRHLNRPRATRERGDGSSPPVISLDLPSGLDADSAGLIGEAVRADLTVSFTAPKPANVLPPASHAGGRLVVADIGSPAVLLEETPSQLFLLEADDARAWLRLTRYAPGSYKNTHGHALVLAGSREMTGAAVLCAGAAMRAGAGLVTVASPASAVPAVAARVMPEVMTAELPETPGGSASAEGRERVALLAERADVIAVGPGLTTAEETRRLVREMVERRTKPLVIDADGLNSLAPWPVDLRGTPELPLVLTPHPGEMRRLAGGAGDSDSNRVSAAREFATAHGVILVLKGSRVLVASPDGHVYFNPTGNAGLGTAGSGDTLTGIITGFLAQAYGTLRERADPLRAVLAAVYVGGAAGDLAAAEHGMRSMVASDVRGQIGRAINEQLTTDESPSDVEEPANGERLETAVSEREQLETAISEREQIEAATREQLGAAVRALDPEGEQPR